MIKTISSLQAFPKKKDIMLIEKFNIKANFNLCPIGLSHQIPFGLIKLPS